LVLLWVLLTEFLLITSMIMAAKYDFVTRFLCNDLGSCGNDQRCCPCNCCCCCSFWSQKSQKASDQTKAAFFVATLLSMMALYIYYETEQNFVASPTTQFFLGL
jgi:hypothetical protein